MKRLGVCFALLWALASIISAQTPRAQNSRPQGTAPARPIAPVRSSAASAPAPPQTFQKYCFECHGTKDPEAGLSIQGLVSQASVGANSQDWERVAGMLESKLMPPLEASQFPT